MSDTDQVPGVDTPCPKCGRSIATHLTVGEALERYAYAKADCWSCHLTTARREPEPKRDEP
jgi:hypothetical protein